MTQRALSQRLGVQLGRIAWPALFGALLLAGWYGAIGLFGIPEYQLPAPHRIVEAGLEERSSLLPGMLQTTRACVVGFFASVVGGALMSLLLAASDWVYRGAYPYIVLLKMTPIIVIAPIIILWAGQGLYSITVITFLVCFFPIVANTTMGLRSTDTGHLDLFAVYKARRWQQLLWLRVPAALPYFMTGLRIAAALTPIGALYGDTVAGMGASDEAGLGFLVIIFNSQLKIPALFAAALASCLIGFLFVGFVNVLSWLALRRWHESYRQEGAP